MQSKASGTYNKGLNSNLTLSTFCSSKNWKNLYEAKIAKPRQNLQLIFQIFFNMVDRPT
jgi:hypothetical protein